MTDERRSNRKEKDDQSMLKLQDIEKLLDQSIKKALSVFQSDIEKFIDKRISAMENKFAAFESRCTDMEKSIENVITLEKKTKLTEEQIINGYQSLPDEVRNLKHNLKQTMIQLNSMEQYSRRGNLRFFGLDLQEDDNCTTSIVRFCRNKLSIEIQESDVASSHPLPPSQHNASKEDAEGNRSAPTKPAIIVRFSNLAIRNLVLSKRKTLKGTGVSIAEDLTTNNVRLLNRLKKMIYSLMPGHQMEKYFTSQMAKSI